MCMPEVNRKESFLNKQVLLFSHWAWQQPSPAIATHCILTAIGINRLIFIDIKITYNFKDISNNLCNFIFTGLLLARKYENYTIKHDMQIF